MKFSFPEKFKFSKTTQRSILLNGFITGKMFLKYVYTVFVAHYIADIKEKQFITKNENI